VLLDTGLAFGRSLPCKLIQVTEPRLLYIIQCESKKSLLWFSDIFSQTVGNFSPSFTCLLYVPIDSGVRNFYSIICNFDEVVILSATIRFTPYAQNVHRRPKRTLPFSDILPKRLENFSPSHAYYTILSTLYYKFLFSYFQFLQSCAFRIIVMLILFLVRNIGENKARQVIGLVQSKAFSRIYFLLTRYVPNVAKRSMRSV